MDFEISDEQKMLIEMCRDFAVKEIRPVARKLDKMVDPKDCWDWDLLKKASKLGLRTASLPKDFGGSGLDLLTMAMMWEELAWGDGGFAYTLTADIFFGRGLPFLSKELRDKALPEFLEDDTYLLAFALSEHRGMTEVLLCYEPGGFDSYAVKQGNEYVINGTKAYASGAPVAKAVVVNVRTDRKGPLSKSWSGFFIPVGTPGFTMGKIHDHLGFRMLLTNELAMEDVRIPAYYLMGDKEGEGKAQHEENAQVVLVFKMSCLLGVLRALYEEALNYARTRVVCGKPIIQHDTIKVMLADMKMRITAARGLVRQIAWDIDHYPEKTLENLRNAFLFKAFVGGLRYSGPKEA